MYPQRDIPETYVLCTPTTIPILQAQEGAGDYIGLVPPSELPLSFRVASENEKICPILHLLALGDFRSINSWWLRVVRFGSGVGVNKAPRVSLEDERKGLYLDVGYTRWVYHGEQFNADEDDLNMLGNDLLQGDEDNEEDMDEDENEDDEDNLFDLSNEHEEFIHNDNNLEGDANGRGYANYIEMLGQAQKELYPSCIKYSQ
ncbi:hypothetical protein LINPERPRIM_LOCUS30876 [Linum perenne]